MIGAGPAAGLHALESPPFTFLHAPGLSADAARLAAAAPGILSRLTRELQAPPLAPTRVVLIERDSGAGGLPEAAGMPGWAAGIALPGLPAVVIRLDRIGGWRQRRLANVFAHEVAHLLSHAAAGPGAPLMPAWFREGTAAALARDEEWRDLIYLWISPIASSRRPLEALEEAFAEPSGLRAQSAYAGSFAFLRFAMQRHGEALPARVLSGLKAGHDFERAWHLAAGMPLAVDEAEWAGSIRGHARWAAILTSAATLWMALTFLFVLAWAIKRRRAAAMVRRWEQEEAAGAPGDEAPPS